MTIEKKYRPQAGQIYTNGALCEPLQLTDAATGKTQWRWVVVSFEDNSYMNGDYVEPAEYANIEEKLMHEIDTT